MVHAGLQGVVIGIAYRRLVAHAAEGWTQRSPGSIQIFVSRTAPRYAQAEGGVPGISCLKHGKMMPLATDVGDTDQSTAAHLPLQGQHELFGIRNNIVGLVSRCRTNGLELGE